MAPIRLHILLFLLFTGALILLVDGQEDFDVIDCGTTVTIQPIEPSTSTVCNTTCITNFSGVSCYDNRHYLNSLVVNLCSDPLEYHLITIDLTTNSVLYNAYNTSSDHEIYNTSINSTELKVHVGRDSRNAHVKVVNTTDNDEVIIPHTTIYLNSSDCMCRSITSLKNRIESPVETHCRTDNECVGVECDMSLDGQSLLIDTEVFPCTDPPGILFVVFDPVANESYFDQFFDRSSNTTLLGSLLRVEIHHLPYSMFIHGVLEGDRDYNVIPQTQIILDKERCNITVTPPTDIPPPTDTSTDMPTGISPKTCNTLQNLTHSLPKADAATCTTTIQCDAINCTTFSGYQSLFILKPCHSPPALGTVIKDEYGDIVYSGLVTNSTEIPLDPYGATKVVIHVDSQPGFMIIEVFVRTISLIDIPLLPETAIPIDECQCVRNGMSYPSSCSLTMTMTPSRPHITRTTTSITNTGSIQTSYSHTRPTSSANVTTSAHKHTPFLNTAAGVVTLCVVFGVSLLIVLTIVTVLVLVCVLRVKKLRSSGYSFQRMSAINVQVEDDDDKAND